MTTPPAQSSSTSHGVLLPVLAIFAGVILVYQNTVAVPLVFDDNPSIRDNLTIRSLWTAWSPPAFDGQTVSGRPLVNFTLALNYAVSGPAAWSYHLLNLLIHAAAGCTLFGVVRRTLLLPALAPRFGRDASLLGLAVALLWTLHPLQTESVTYVIQRAESLAGLMYLLVLWCFIRATAPGAFKWWEPLAFLACLLGMMTKEVMVTAPVMVALYDRVFLAFSWREVWAKRGQVHLALGTTWLLLGWLVFETGSRGGTAGLGGDVSPWAYALTQIGAVGHYLQLAVWPHPLVFDYGMTLADGWSEVWAPALVLFPLLAASLWAAWRGRAAGYCGLFFFAVLAPSSSFVPVVTQTMAEHRVYLALAGPVALAVTGLYAAWGRRSFVVFAVLAVALGATTVFRNRDYRTELALWEDTARKCPGNARAFSTIGAIHQWAGRLDEARAALEETVRLLPQSSGAHNNLGNLFMKLGRWEEARACFEQANRLDPDDPFVLNNLGNALLLLDRLPAAVAQFEAALRLDPTVAISRYNLAKALVRSGRLPEAAIYFESYLHTNPRDTEARIRYAQVLQALGRGAEAAAPDR